MEIGVDIVKVERIEKAILKNENFKYKVFTSEEIKYCESKKNKYESYAGKFAAKEAFKKAVNTAVEFKEIEVLNEESGKAYIKYKDLDIKLSISHEKEYAIAMLILEK